MIDITDITILYFADGPYMSILCRLTQVTTRGCHETMGSRVAKVLMNSWSLDSIVRSAYWSVTWPSSEVGGGTYSCNYVVL